MGNQTGRPSANNVNIVPRSPRRGSESVDQVEDVGLNGPQEVSAKSCLQINYAFIYSYLCV